MASLYKRKNSKYWWVKYYLNGIPKYASTQCTKKFDARLVLQERYEPLERNVRHNKNIFHVEIPVLECLKTYKESVLIHSDKGIRPKAQGTINRQQKNADNFADYLRLKNLQKFHEITEETISDYIQVHLFGTCQKKPNTVYKDVQILKNFFGWAVRKGYCMENPTIHVKNSKPTSPKVEYFTEEEVKKIFANAKEPYCAMFKILYLTGLRIQELLNLEWKYVDFKRKQLTIPEIEGNKAKRETYAHLNTAAVKIFKELEIKKAENVFVFTNGNGNQYAQSKISSYAIRLYQRLGISTKIPLHKWRHTCASHLVDKNVSLYTVKEILRHRSIKETEIYAKQSDEAIQKAIRKLSL